MQNRTIDVYEVETAVSELFEYYRQSLQAVEKLPVFGPLPSGELIVGGRNPRGDWVRNRVAIRSIVRIFLRSHIRSKIRYITERLELERISNSHVSTNALSHLDNTLEKLRNFNRWFKPRSPAWLKPIGWVWAIAAPPLITYLTTLVVHSSGIAIQGLLADFVLYVLYFALLVYLPAFFVGSLNGFRWKRLILVGQVGDVNVITNRAETIRWISAPQNNSYKAENRVFEALALPKPIEFPWDLILWPITILLAALSIASFALAVDVLIPLKELSWPVLIAIFLFVLSFLLFRWLLRPILGGRRERNQRGIG